MQRGPNLSALRAPVQFLTGCGSLQRRSSTGGWANGIPLKLRTAAFGVWVDSSMPLAVLTRSAANPSAKDAAQRQAEMKKVRFSDLMELLVTDSTPGRAREPGEPIGVC